MLKLAGRGARRFIAGVAIVLAGLGSAADGLMPGVDEIRSRIEAIETSSTLDAWPRQRALELYRAAVANLEAWERDTASAREFARALEEAPDQTARWERKSASVSVAPLHLPEDIEVLSRDLAAEQARLAELQAELESVKEAATAESELELSEMLLEVQAALAQPQQPAAEDLASAEVMEAYEIASTARQRALRAKAEMLQQRLLSRDPRLAVMGAHRRHLTLVIDGLTERVEDLRSHVNEARQRVAGRTARRAEALVTRLDEQPEWVRELAGQNADLAAQIAEVTKKTENLTNARSALADQKAQIARYHDNLTQQLAVTGAEQSAELGRAMVRQRKRLEEMSSEPDYEDLEQQITSARLRQLDLEDQRLSESTLRPPDWANRDNIDRYQVLANTLRAERLDLLDEGVAAYRRYITEMTGIRSDAKALAAERHNYQRLLNHRLFWIPSSDAFGVGSWPAFGHEIAWIGAQAAAVNPHETLTRFVVQSPTGSVLALLALGLCFPVRKHCNKWLSRLDRDSESLASAGMWSTVREVGASMVAAAPVPLVLYALGAVLGAGTGLYQALGAGLQTGALICFAFLAFGHLCQPDGVAHRQFLWSQPTLATLRSNLPYLSIALTSMVVLLGVTEASGEAADSSGFSRLVFAAGLLAVAFLGYRIVHGQLAANPAAASMPWAVRTLTPLLVVLIPLSLLGLSLVGYHFTAQQLANRCLITVAIVTIGIVSFYVAVRAISLAEGRMASSEIRSKHLREHAYSNNRRAAETAGEGVPDALDLQEIDVNAVGLQTRSVVKMAVGAITAGFVWGLWSDMLPAFGVLDEVVLWHSGPNSDAVTLTSLLLAAFIAFLTYFGYRNLPGALEVSVLTRIKLEPGSSFAIMTISKYLIAFAGTFTVISLLGAQWAQLQWLVAALGVGLGFGLQEVVANFVSGILILFERPIRVGDTVTVGNQTGTVSRIRIRSTAITDGDRKEHIIPNKMFINEQVTNWTLRDSITRLVVKVAVAHGSDVAAVQQVLLDVAKSNPRVLGEPPPTIFFMGFGDNRLDFEIRVFTRNLLDRMPLTHELHSAIDREFKRHGIEVPSPLRDLEQLAKAQSGMKRLEPRKAGPAGELPIVKERNI